MKHAVGRRVCSVLLAAVIVLAATIILSRDAAMQELPGQPGLVAASPPPNALLAAVPPHIELEFAAPIDPQSASVRLLGPSGTDVSLGPLQIAQPEAQRVLAPLPGQLAGDFVVIWSARAADDDALLAGAFPFRGGAFENPGAAQIDNQWPRPWASVLRWLVFLGTSMAAGGFGWALMPVSGSGSRAPLSLGRAGLMTAGAASALLATAVLPLGRLMAPPTPGVPLATLVRSMPPGWWLQVIALSVLTLVCLGLLAVRRRSTRLPRGPMWGGLIAGLAALVGLSLTSHAATAVDRGPLAIEIAHQWSAALWFSGLVYLIGSWRDYGTDVARFRAVRWVGGVLIAVSVVTGIARALPLFPSVPEALTVLYGRVLTIKSLIVLVIVVLGLLALVVPRRSNAVLASGSLAMQGGLALVTALLAALLALMPIPGTVVRASLAGVDLVQIVPLDASVFGNERGTVHMLVQPASEGPHTIVVRLTDVAGAPLVTDPVPDVEVTWTSLTGTEPLQTETMLQPDASGTLFTGAATLPVNGWWQAEVDVLPPGGVASRATYWMALPDPSLTGRGPDPVSERAARELFEQGQISLTSLRAVRFTDLVNDGAGDLVRVRSAVSEGNEEQPAALQETTIDAMGAAVSEQRIVGERRWILPAGSDWREVEPIPLQTPAQWAPTYTGATGFQLGPRESVDGELSQIITFWMPTGRDGPAWYAWWIGLASGEVRRQAEISPRHYAVTDFSDFDAPVEIVPPATATPAGASGTPAAQASPIATPGRRVQP